MVWFTYIIFILSAWNTDCVNKQEPGIQEINFANDNDTEETDWI